MAFSLNAQVPSYYYQGRHKVKVEIATDALSIETTAPLPIPAFQSTGTQARPGVSGTTTLLPGKNRVSINTKSLSELNSKAQFLKRTMPGTSITAILNSPRTQSSESPSYLTEQVSFQLAPGKTIAAITARYKLHGVHPAGYAPDTYIANVDTTTSITASLTTANTMQESGDAIWASPLIQKQQQPRAIPNDPMFINQWHLNNTGTNTANGIAGNDLNVVPAWDNSIGSGVNIAINDDGVDTAHPDLSAHIRTDLDYDFNDNDDDANPASTDGHGTSCAGAAAAVTNNATGVSGVSPDSAIIALRLLGAPVSDAQEAASLAWKATESDPNNQAHINSDSWGPSDSGTVLEGPGPLAEQALIQGVTSGRNGKGIVYTWAAGNGGSIDNINKDGYANSPWVIAVGASNSSGKSCFYSEPGASMLVNAPSGEGLDNILTTDITSIGGYNNTDYNPGFNGTSAAAPCVAGVVALLLSVNPALTYRDVMHIFVNTSTQNDPVDPGWQTNGAGHKFSHSYGFGRVNAGAAVAAASTWTNVPPPATNIEIDNILTSPLAIPDNYTTGVTLDIPVTSPPNFKIEHVELEANILHEIRGDVVIYLQSPSGTVSVLMYAPNDLNPDYSNWRFRSVAHWDETPTGTWEVRFADVYADFAGTVTSLKLRIQGYIDPTADVDGWELYN